ncbi:hypothetical protein MBLNU13_g08932t2 [Cladosporium sp. NU13]
MSPIHNSSLPSFSAIAKDILRDVDRHINTPTTACPGLEDHETLGPEKLMDTRTRFLLWTGNLGVMHKAEDPRALDRRLLDAPEVAGRIRDILGDFQGLLSQSGRPCDCDASQRSSTEKVGPMDDEDAMMMQLLGLQTSKKCTTSWLAASLDDTLRRLFHLSSLITKSSTRDKFHVREKVKHASGRADEGLVTRLGKANTSRRQFIAYSHEHNAELSHLDPDHDQESDQRHAEHAMSDKNSIGHSVLRSEITKQSAVPTKASTLGFLDPNAFDYGLDDARSCTTVATSIVDGQAFSGLKVPELAQYAEPGEHFICPLCQTVQRFNGQVAWRHLEEIALFVVPQPEEDQFDSDNVGSNAVHAAQGEDSATNSTLSSFNSKRPSVASIRSQNSLHDESNRVLCPYPGCGRHIKNLLAHMLTHSHERPEKCPVPTCTMVCGFCPNSVTPAEKSFNRVDVFKRHLTSSHGVVKISPNVRRHTDAESPSDEIVHTGAGDGSKCSNCGNAFSSAQIFYKHLDDCVLSIIESQLHLNSTNASSVAHVSYKADEVAKEYENSALQSGASFTAQLVGEPDQVAKAYSDDVLTQSEAPSSHFEQMMEPLLQRSRTDSDKIFKRAWGGDLISEAYQDLYFDFDVDGQNIGNSENMTSEDLDLDRLIYDDVYQDDRHVPPQQRSNDPSPAASIQKKIDTSSPPSYSSYETYGHGTSSMADGAKSFSGEGYGGYSSSVTDGYSTTYAAPTDTSQMMGHTPHLMLPLPQIPLARLPLPPYLIMEPGPYSCDVPDCTAAAFQTQYLLKYVTRISASLVTSFADKQQRAQGWTFPEQTVLLFRCRLRPF